MFHLVLKVASSIFAFQLAASEAQAVEVYLFKGAGDFSFISENMHFSRGLDRMADQLGQEGIYAEVLRFGEIADALRTIRRRKPQSVAFIGHSMGALAAMRMARKMRSEGVAVAYVATIDIPGPIGTAGGNVSWAENYYSVTPVFGLLTNVRTHPRAKNIYVFGQVHATLDDAKKVRDGVLGAIREIHATEQNDPVMPVEKLKAAMPSGSAAGAGSAIGTEVETSSDSVPFNLLAAPIAAASGPLSKAPPPSVSEYPPRLAIWTQYSLARCRSRPAALPQRADHSSKSSCRGLPEKANYFHAVRWNAECRIVDLFGRLASGDHP